MKKNRKYWKRECKKALGQGFKAIELATTALETLKALQVQVDVLQAPKIDLYTVDYRQ